MALLLHTFSNPRFLCFFACIILSLFRSGTYRFRQFRFYLQLYMYTLLRYKAKNFFLLIQLIENGSCHFQHFAVDQNVFNAFEKGLKNA